MMESDDICTWSTNRISADIAASHQLLYMGEVNVHVAERFLDTLVHDTFG